MTYRIPAETTRYGQAQQQIRLAKLTIDDTRRRAQIYLTRLPKEPSWITQRRLDELEDAVCSPRETARRRRARRRARDQVSV